MYRKIRICLVALTLFACSAMSLWEAGALGAGVGTVTTMVLDDDPDIVVDGAAIQTAESNAFSVLEVAIDNAIPLSILILLLWLMPSPKEIIRRIKNAKTKENK